MISNFKKPFPIGLGFAQLGNATREDLGPEDVCSPRDGRGIECLTSPYRKDAGHSDRAEDRVEIGIKFRDMAAAPSEKTLYLNKTRRKYRRETQRSRPRLTILALLFIENFISRGRYTIDVLQNDVSPDFGQTKLTELLPTPVSTQSSSEKLDLCTGILQRPHHVARGPRSHAYSPAKGNLLVFAELQIELWRLGDPCMGMSYGEAR